MGAAAIPAAIGLQVAGSAFAADSAQQAGKAQEGYYRYLASTSDANANLTELGGKVQSRSIQDAAAAEYVQNLRNVKRVEGSQRAGFAANGIAGSVTAEDIARDTNNTAKLDEMAITYNADTQSSEVLRQAGITAMNQRSEAAGYRMAGSQARIAGNRSAIASLIGGASSVASTIPMASARTPASPVPRASGGSYLPPKLSLFAPAGTSRRPY